MNATRNTRATQGNRTVTVIWHTMPGARQQTIQEVRDTFVCTDGIPVVRVTSSIRMQIRDIEGRNWRTIEQNHTIRWETTDGHFGWMGTMMQAHRIACESN